MRGRAPLVFARLLAIAALGLGASGCSTLGYYAHVTHGQASLLAHRRPIDQIVGDETVDEKLRSRLAETQDARRFASDHLGLPRNKSYTTYVDLGRPYVTWNVFATRGILGRSDQRTAFRSRAASLTSATSKRRKREREAARLRGDGDDVAVEGAAAYSTLGWFADPILSSMMRWSDDELDGVIFHELAHQLVYVKDDTAFNESFATFVQQEGLREWRASRGLPPADAAEAAHDDAFTALILDLRERLRTLYASELRRARDARSQAARNRRFPRALPPDARRRVGRRSALRCLGRSADQQRTPGAFRVV